MLGKGSALLYLRQPLKYATGTFSTGGNISAGRSFGEFSPISFVNGIGITETLNAENFKLHLSGSVGMESTGFYNYIADGRGGGVKIDSLHIGRRFNRTTLPKNSDCFFSTGNMGSSNGTVTPSVPSEWADRDRKGNSKADVYAIKITEPGETGVAKFKYGTYPFPCHEFYISKYGCTEGFSGYPYRFFSDTLLYQSSGDNVIVRGTNENYSTEALYAESRSLGTDNIHFTMPDGNTIRTFTDPTLTIKATEISLTDGSGNPLNLYMVTYAQGNFYGINTEKVYKINPITGVGTEVAGTARPTEDVFILASLDQSIIVCVTDKIVSTINPVDDSVSTKVKPLDNETPSRNDIFSRVIIDKENSFWYSGNKYDLNTMERIFTFGSRPDNNFSIFGFEYVLRETSRFDYYFYDLDGTLIQEGHINDRTQYRDFSSMKMLNNQLYISMEGTRFKFYTTYSPDDTKLLTMHRRHNLLDWRIKVDGAWVKGWHKQILRNDDGTIRVYNSASGKPRDVEEFYTKNLHLEAGTYNSTTRWYKSKNGWTYDCGGVLRFVNVDTGEEVSKSYWKVDTAGNWLAITGDIVIPTTGYYDVYYTPKTSTSSATGGVGTLELTFSTPYEEKDFILDYLPSNVEAGSLNIYTADGTLSVSDNGDGTLSDGGTIDYVTGALHLNTAPAKGTYLLCEFEGDSETTGTNITLQDGVVVDFENGAEMPHFVADDYFVFTVAEGHIVDNLEEYSTSADVYIVPFHDVASEVFTINSENMNVASQSLTGFIKLDSDIGLTGSIGGIEATITTSQTPDAGAIGVDYNTGALYFNAADNGKQAIINYRWLERP